MIPAKITKQLNTEVKTTLSELGFDYFKGRRAYLNRNDMVIVFSTKAVGSYFSKVTGYPSCSFYTNVGIHFNFIPSNEILPISNGKYFAPKTVHISKELTVFDMSTQDMRKCSNRQEKERNDIWWVEKDGKNLSEVIDDLKSSILLNVKPWLDSTRSLQNTLELVKTYRDCPLKDYHLYHLSKKTRNDILINKYSGLVSDPDKIYPMVEL